MVFEKRQLSKLKPAKYNPRKKLTPDDAEYQKIKRSIEHFGYVDPIIINSDGTIIGGHQRHTVLKDLGYTEADVVVVDLSKEDEKALNVALNKITGEWDETLLKNLLVDLDKSDYDFTLTGVDKAELDELIELSDFEAEVSEDGFDAQAAYQDSQQQETIIKPGEVWQLGNHRLMCGDSSSIDDVHKLLGEERLDLVITDPPYNVNYEEKAAALNEYRPNNNGAMRIENDLMDDRSFYSFLLKAFTNMKDYMRDGAAVYVFHADIEGLTFRKAFDDAGLRLSEVLIWEKNNFVLGRQDYQWRHEPVLYGWKEGAGHYFVHDRTQNTVILEDEVDFESMKKAELVAYIKDIVRQYADQTTVIYEKKPMSSNLHPTMKPLELIGRFVKNSSKPGWNVGDFFGGSGSTLMAAEQLDRNAFVMELDEHYASVIIRRWEEFTGRKARKMGD
ncbi:MAG: DNA modification methylase [Lachnospiraceae bacterium]|nr:DNA modification methylase [Lachnospiraceae bacterium]